MEIMSIKSDLHAIIDQTNDVKVLEAVKTLLQSKMEERDFWDQLPDFQKRSIERGLLQASRGETLTHEEVMKKFEKWPSK
jgi:predicted transcriptional regulator